MIAIAAAAFAAHGMAMAGRRSHWPDPVYLLRPAEEISEDADSPLIPAGWQRAGGMAASLSTVREGAIRVTDKQRARQTPVSRARIKAIKPFAFPRGDHCIHSFGRSSNES